MLFIFFSEPLYSIVKEGTARWLKGPVGSFCFREVSSQGAWWWPPRSMVLQTQPPLAVEELQSSGSRRQDPALPCLAQLSSSEIPVAPRTETPPQTKPAPPQSYPTPHEEKGQILPHKGPACPVLTGAPFLCNASAVNRGKG